MKTKKNIRVAQAKYKKEYAIKNRDKINLYKREYYKKNRNKIKELQKKSYIKKREKVINNVCVLHQKKMQDDEFKKNFRKKSKIFFDKMIELIPLTEKHRRPWSIEEEDFLLENYCSSTLEKIAKRLGRTYRAVEIKKRRLGIIKNKKRINSIK